MTSGAAATPPYSVGGNAGEDIAVSSGIAMGA